MFEKIHLQVLSTNECALQLYRALGFVEAGRRRNEIKFGPQQVADDVSMELLLWR